MELNQMLSRMALELADLETRDETIEAVADYARIAVVADDAGVMLVHGDNRVETPAGTSDNVDKAHQLQAQFGEGPCLSALAGGNDIYVVANTLEDARWPTWGAAAAELGYRSVVSASMHTDSRRIGSLNVYSRTPNAFDYGDADVVGLLSGHATAAVAAAKKHDELQKALDLERRSARPRASSCMPIALTPVGPSPTCDGSRRTKTSNSSRLQRASSKIVRALVRRRKAQSSELATARP